MNSYRTWRESGLLASSTACSPSLQTDSPSSANLPASGDSGRRRQCGSHTLVESEELSPSGSSMESRRRTSVSATFDDSTLTPSAVPTSRQERPSSIARCTTSSTLASRLRNPRNVRVTPFYARQKELGAVFFETSGWERPQWYDANEGLLDSLTVAGESRSGWEAREWSPTVAAEHVATRERVAMFDLTPFAKFEVSGPKCAQGTSAPCCQSDEQACRDDNLHANAHALRRDEVRPYDHPTCRRPLHGGYGRRNGTP